MSYPILQSTDNQAVQLRFRTDSVNRRIIAVDGSDNQETQIVLGDNGTVQFLGATVSDENVVISSTGIQVKRSITLNRTQIHPDYVFSSSYPLETISEHRGIHVANKHLPAVRAQALNVGGERSWMSDQTLGMFEELEKAHIYIEQLNKRSRASNGALINSPSKP